MGYDKIEIPVEDPILIDVAKVKKALIENDLEPIMYGAFGPGRDLTNDDPSIHKACFNYIEACLIICEKLEASSLLFHQLR